MPEPHLDLAALRALPPEQPDVRFAVDRLTGRSDPIVLSRRGFLGLGGASVVAATSLGRGAQAAWLGPFTVLRGDGRVAFALGGLERWIVDCSRFAGEPRLTLERAGAGYRLTLAGARYAGTDLPADFTCELQPALLGWRMDLHVALGDLRASAPFERWLMGREPASGTVRLPATACEFGDARLSLGGTGEGRYWTSGGLEMAGDSLARLSHRGATYASDRVHVLPAVPGAPSILCEADPRRTVLSIERGTRSWAEVPLPPTEGRGLLRATGRAFDVARVEAAECGAAALLLEGAGEAGDLTYTPGPTVQAADGTPIAVPLREARLAMTLTGARESALVGRLKPEPFWAHGPGMSLRLGDAPGDPAFELAARDGVLARLRFDPGLRGWHAPLAGAVSGIAYAPEGTRATLVSYAPAGETPPSRQVDPAKRAPVGRAPARRDPAVVDPKTKVDPAVVQPDRQVVGPGRERVITDLALEQWSIDAVRPADLLSLRFEFRNLKVDAQAKPAVLTRIKPGGATWIIVHFPPQHIGEEAFFEADPAYVITDPNDPDRGKQSLEPTALPVQSRLSGPSRIAFRVPKSVDTIPYSLAGLLDWGRFELSVGPAAVPPPMPASIADVSDAGPLSMAVNLGGSSGPAVLPRLPSVADARKAFEAVASVSDLEMLQNAAQAATRDPLAAPLETETALEIPYRLVMSPHRFAGWIHRSDAATREGWTELWHTRLGVRTAKGHLYDGRWEFSAGKDELEVVDESVGELASDRLRTLRAVWSPDAGPSVGRRPSDDSAPFRMSLSPRDRHELVWLTSRVPDSLKRFVRTERLMLSSLGGWIDCRYADDPPDGVNLEEWRHQATMGRDQYVRVVSRGYLFPFGHRASLVKVTERKFQQTPDGSGTMAVLRQRMYIIVRQPERTYGASGLSDGGKSVDRQMPFVRVRIHTRVTPNIDPPTSYAGGLAALDAFCPAIGDRDFLFHLTAVDLMGNVSEFTAPLVFVSNTERDSAKSMRAVAEQYAKDERRTRAWDGQKVALAEAASATSEDTTLEARSLSFGAFVPAQSTALQPDQPRFLPLIAEAQVGIPALAQLTGEGQQPVIRYNAIYLAKGFDPGANQAGMFADIDPASGAPALKFPAEMAGALAAPSASISGLSRVYGPTAGDTGLLAAGTFTPSQFLDDSAQLFGCIPLAGIIAPVFGGERVPGITSEVERNASGLPTAIRSRFDWDPDVQPFDPFFRPRAGGKLTMRGEMTTPVAPSGAPGKATYSLRTTLSEFEIDLYSFVVAEFESLEFVSRSEHKPDTIVKIRDVRFGGPLVFLNPLKDYLGGAAFTDGPGLDVSASGVVVSYSTAIPTVAVGAFSLQNLKLSGALSIPFDGTPLGFRFAFCERHDPFLVIVSLFGGGGFFALTLYPKKELIKIEGSIEFGACVALNLGVASGSVYVMAGIYFAWQDSKAAFSGYLRVGGSLSVLGLITINAEFYMALNYDDGRVWGQATLTVEVEVLFFSKTVSMTVEREFAGGGTAFLDREVELAALPSALPSLLAAPVPAGSHETLSMRKPPLIKDALTPDDWASYCAAFA
jgi:hypothetical protein